jgi:hypothetical protein
VLLLDLDPQGHASLGFRFTVTMHAICMMSLPVRSSSRT